MALKLYRRHSIGCKGGHLEDSRSGKFEEGRRGWKRCDCLIHASGTLAGRFKRKQTEKSDWDKAEAVAATWEHNQSWDAPVDIEEPASEPANSDKGRITIVDAFTAFLAVRGAAKIAPSTLRKYMTFAKQLRAFAENRGYVFLDQFRTADIDAFYAAWNLGARAKGKELGRLRGFFRFCVNREWSAKTPVSSDLKPPLGANRVANKVPFTDSELERIVNACDRIETVQWKNGRFAGLWTGEDVKDFVWMLTYTGLRISDVALFHMNRLHGNEVFLRAKKNGGDVFTWLPDWLVDG
jgi:integrase